MNGSDDDRMLRRHFEALRTDDADLDPGFATLRPDRPARAAARPARRRRAAALAAGLAAAAAAILWLAVPRPGPAVRPGVDPPSVPRTASTSSRGAPAAPVALGRWAMPTDVLLDLSGWPGDALLRELPRLGPAAVPPSVPEPPPGRPDLSRRETRSPVA